MYIHLYMKVYTVIFLYKLLFFSCRVSAAVVSPSVSAQNRNLNHVFFAKKKFDFFVGI